MRVEQRELPDTRVHVTDTSVARKGWLRCELGTNLEFTTAGLSSYFFARWEEVVFDCLLVAAAVEFCDRTKKRTPLGWARDISVHIPVHDPDHWRTTAVSGPLHDALELLTGDRWAVTFGQRRKAEVQPQQQSMPLPSGTKVVMPFSDGLDSRAVGALMEEKHGDTLVRMRLGKKKQDQPVNRSGRKQPFWVVPYKVSSGDERFRESTARSRGFKFAILSGVAAYLAKANTVIVSESGQGALGPALVPVGHAHEDYRNHPLFTSKMTTFFRALLGHEIIYDFPRLWFTKGETVAAYATFGRDDWKATRSCWQDNRYASVDGHWRHCGICAACMLRRMSLHSAGLREAAGNYIWDDLTVPGFADAAAQGFRDKTKVKRHYAIAGALHLHHMAELRSSPLARQTIELSVFQLSRSLALSKEVVREKLDRMLSQHKKEWEGFLDSLGQKSFVAQWVT